MKAVRGCSLRKGNADQSAMRSVRSRGFHSRRCYRGGLRLPDGLSGALGRKYADEPARATLIFKAHVASNAGKQRVVLPAPHVQAGLVLGPALPNQNGAGIDELPREALHTQPLSGRVPAVYRRSATFFVCHNLICFPALAVIPSEFALRNRRPGGLRRGADDRGICFSPFFALTKSG
jgi:hypothetical protein